ncbi:MAG: HAD family hydrolase [Parvularculaceae bacterium]
MEELGFVFDLDDTLYPERDYVRSCFRWVAAQLGDRLAPDTIYTELSRLFDAGDPDPVGIVCAGLSIGAIEKLSMIDAMRAHAPSIALDPGAAALIGALRGRGRRFSIITNGRSVTQRRKIEALGLGDAAAIIVSEEFGAAKPDLRLFKAVAAAHPARRHIFAGDNPAIDFAGPNALGWMSVMLAREDGVRRAVFEPAMVQQPQRTVASLDELMDLL